MKVLLIDLRVISWGDFDRDNDRLEELRALLESFSEPTNQDLA